jgi:DNA polymerase III subunit tau, C-terminal domain
MLREARPIELESDTLVLEFPATAAFHRKLAEDPKNATLLEDALYEVTGRRLALQFELGDEAVAREREDDAPVSEEELLQLMKETFDAREVDE